MAWVFSSLFPGGKVLSEEQKEAEGKALMDRLDENGDGDLEWSEFASWFKSTCRNVNDQRRIVGVEALTSGADLEQAAMFSLIDVKRTGGGISSDMGPAS